MCMACMMDPWFYGEVFPGWYLLRARREYFDTVSIKDWALQRCNDPDVWFTVTPILHDDEEQFYDALNSFSEELLITPDLGYQLISAFKNVPATFRLKRLFVRYGRYLRRNLMAQLYIYLADFIAQSNPIADEFSFGDNGFKYDYTFDPKQP